MQSYQKRRKSNGNLQQKQKPQTKTRLTLNKTTKAQRGAFHFFALLRRGITYKIQTEIITEV
jgi:hypothetical protein